MKNTTGWAVLTVLVNFMLVAMIIAVGNSASGSSGLAILIFTPIIILLGELIFGIVFAVSDTKKDIGAGLLIGLGATLLIGLSICGVMMRM